MHKHSCGRDNGEDDPAHLLSELHRELHQNQRTQGGSFSTFPGRAPMRATSNGRASRHQGEKARQWRVVRTRAQHAALLHALPGWFAVFFYSFFYMYSFFSLQSNKSGDQRVLVFGALGVSNSGARATMLVGAIFSRRTSGLVGVTLLYCLANGALVAGVMLLAHNDLDEAEACVLQVRRVTGGPAHPLGRDSMQMKMHIRLYRLGHMESPCLGHLH